MVRTIVIIGGGFSGTLTAVHLLARGGGLVDRIVVVNRSGAMARGVAYGTQSDQHVLNVPAGRMSAFPDAPDSFVRFVRERGVTADGGTFVPRHLYGAYLESLLTDAAARARGVTLERLATEVLRVEPAADGTHAWIALRDGARVRADRVVLAVGNYPPADPDVPDRDFFRASARYVSDPWRAGALDIVDAHAPTLLIGTGLTMADIVLSLRTRGTHGTCGQLIAISRRGLVPQPHRAHAPGSPPPAFASAPVPPASGSSAASLAGTLSAWAATLASGPVTARACVRAVRDRIREGEAQGVDWRDYVAALRPVTPRIWQALTVSERQRFLRHARSFWEVHRHRMSPAPYEAFADLQRDGHLSVLAGRLLSVHDERDGAIVRVRCRGTRETRELKVGTVINCTGPAGDTRRLRDALFERLVADGLITPDVLGLGIETTATGALVGRDGRASSTLYYVGPFLRARDWEATAVPELRQYAWQLADHLLATLDARAEHGTDPAGARSPTSVLLPDAP